MSVDIKLAGSATAWGGVLDAGKVILYDASGNAINLANKGTMAATVGGVPILGRDYKLARNMRVGSFGGVKGTDDQPLLWDNIEGAAVDTNRWIQSTSTMTIVQAVASGITFNAGSSVAINVYAIHTSHRLFPLIARNPLIFRTRLRHVFFANSVAEFGFGAPVTNGAAITNGAFFRRKTGGQLVGLISANGTETETAAAGAPPANTDYALYEILYEDNRATFIVTSDAGVIVWQDSVEVPATLAVRSTVSHIPAFHRIYNTGSAPATAPQIIVSETAVYGCDMAENKTWGDTLSGLCQCGATSPTAFTQLANYVNSTGPVSATLSNTAAGYTTLGGQFQWVAVAGAETDYALFGFQAPATHQLYINGIDISTWNMGAAAAATPTLLSWACGINASAVSLATAAPYAPMRVALGSQQLVASAAIGIAFAPDIKAVFEPALCVQPGRFFHIILKSVVSAATASEILRGLCKVTGYFE